MSAGRAGGLHPAVLGRYQLIEPLAKGGMAEVFKARLVAPAGAEKVVCIKRILPQLSRDPEFVSLFVQEAKIALTLAHGNITQVFDFGEADGSYFLAMEYIEGRNLHEVLGRLHEVGRLLDVPAALYIALETCKGLQHAHSRTNGPGGQASGVVHRDVTPQNILISFNGEVKLTDFGIALAASKAETAGGGVLRGKACYLAPEQVAGEPGEPRNDLFSLGAVLYEMLTGTRPFQGETEAQTLERILTVDPAPPSHHNEAVDAELDQVVMRALARCPADRHARAGEMQVALTQAQHRQWPEYTAERLAETMQELFAWEIAQARGKSGGCDAADGGDGEGGDGAGGPVRDRLAQQLAGAGFALTGAESTSELLQLGTVAIGSSAGPGPRKRLPFLVGAAGAAMLAVAALVLLLWIRPWAGGATDPAEGAESDELPRIGATEHIIPPSSAAPPALASEGGAAGAAGVASAAARPLAGRNPSSARGDSSGTAPAADRAVRSGYLNCNSWPWSIVYLDGRRLPGNTPIYRVPVTAGRHRLRFENPELSLSREVFVTVAAGATRTVAVSLQP